MVDSLHASSVEKFGDSRVDPESRGGLMTQLAGIWVWAKQQTTILQKCT